MSSTNTLQSSSQYLSSAHPSLHQYKKVSSELSKTYKHASQLFLTRRLAEAYEVLVPVISPAQQANGHSSHDEDTTPKAPIVTASTSQRIKIWSLYITLLNAICDLTRDEGSRDFGRKEHKAIVERVRAGEVWEQVIRDGYRGREGLVDAEVVYNLSTLLLGQATNQKLNQSRLETYLSSPSQPDLDISNLLNRTSSPHAQAHINGTATPKDLTSRLKILELFTLHVLPRNEEWEYARSFITNSDILDDERRETFLTTLKELQEMKDHEAALDQEDEEIQREQEQTAQNEAESAARRKSEGSPYASTHRRTGSEVDYGIEATHPNGTNAPITHKASHLNGHHTTSAANSTKLTEQPPVPMSDDPPVERHRAQAHLSPRAQTPKKGVARRSPQTRYSDLLAQARNLYTALQNVARSVANGISGNPTVLFRMLLFVVAFLLAFSRKGVRERVKLAIRKSYEKVQQTVGMGVKVSYI